MSNYRHEKTLILVRGLPGSGKTTLARIIGEVDMWTVMYAADDFFYDAEGNYNFDASKLGVAHKNCLESTRESLEGEVHDRVVVHNTFTTEKEIKPYRELAEAVGARLISLVVENRHGNKSEHGVPEETMDKMRNRFSVRL